MQKDESLKEWLELCAVSLNDEIIFDENTKLKDGDKIALLPPVCGVKWNILHFIKVL